MALVDVHLNLFFNVPLHNRGFGIFNVVVGFILGLEALR